MADIFSSYQKHLDVEQDLRDDIRDIVKTIDAKLREIITILQIIHQEGGLAQIPSACEKSKSQLITVKEGYAKLAEKIKSLSYYRFNDHWKYISQRSTFIIALILYLEDGNLATLDHVTQTLGIKSSQKDGFHMELDEYLVGILQLASELSRFAVNAVIYGDYKRPLHISNFVAEMSAGFSILTLRNDYVRKRFDTLKYDIKKIEEIVYDLSIRGLKGEETGEGSVPSNE